LTDLDSQTVPLFFEERIIVDNDRGLILVEIKPGETRIIGALSINVPPLEDIREPFWENHLKNLSDEGKEFQFCATVISYSATNPLGDADKYESLPFTLEIPILMKPRPNKETAMIEKWYKNTPQRLFPKAESGENSIRKIPGQGISQIPESKAIRVQNVMYNQWCFIRLGNRYPGDPNAPATWQEWKKLEDSLTPSTMKDEIRLTRILIQYCDTRDAKVLDELKKWFDGMNEVQRACMAKSILDRAESCYDHGKLLLPLFRDLYNTVSEYDIADKAKHKIEWLKQLGLLE